MPFLNESSRPYEIRGWDIGYDGFDLDVRVNNFRFRIKISSECFAKSPQELHKFHQMLEKLFKGYDDEPKVWMYGAAVADLFIPDFQRLAPPLKNKDILTLADFAVRGTFHCEYRVVDETPSAGAVTAYRPVLTPFEEWDIRLLQSTYAVFKPEDVEVLEADNCESFDTLPRKVRIGDKDYFYKPTVSPYDAIDSTNKYKKLAIAHSAGNILVSRLFGVVVNNYGHGKGLIYDWIDTKDGETLTRVLQINTPISVREKWVLQIQGTLLEMHKLGVLWGDVKADNVLIDTQDNAVIIDLEGGTTRGWVDPELEGTVAGDLQGLTRLVCFILNDDSPLRLGR